jgi:hypothetical protein
MSVDEIEKGVLKIVGRFSGKQTTTASELYHDLHIHGDDAGELLEEIHKQYETSFIGFNFNNYFPNEGEALPRFAKWPGFKDKAVSSLTVAHLASVVRCGHWFDPT